VGLRVGWLVFERGTRRVFPKEVLALLMASATLKKRLTLWDAVPLLARIPNGPRSTLPPMRTPNLTAPHGPSPAQRGGRGALVCVHIRGRFRPTNAVTRCASAAGWSHRTTQDAQGERQYGLIAEEVAKVYPELVTRNAQGQVDAIRYQELTPMLLNEVQHQQRQLGAQARELAELKAQNARLRAAVGQVQEQAVQQQALQAQNAALAARLERLEAAAAQAATLASR